MDSTIYVLHARSQCNTFDVFNTYFLCCIYLKINPYKEQCLLRVELYICYLKMKKNKHAGTKYYHKTYPTSPENQQVSDST